MASAKYHEFILRIAQYGFPVRFLREVEAGYNILRGPSSLVLPWFNLMLLEPHEFDAIEFMESPNLGASTGITNIYHESTHAWLDMNQSRPDVAKLIAHGTALYQGAPVEGGGKPDSNRLFQEAIASYVGHRVAARWDAIEQTRNLEILLKKHRGRAGFERADQAAKERIPKSYDAAMNARVFGFQSRCSSCAQQYTSRPISGELKRFADATLLESKIPEQFARTGETYDKWRGLNQSR